MKGVEETNKRVFNEPSDVYINRSGMSEFAVITRKPTDNATIKELLTLWSLIARKIMTSRAKSKARRRKSEIMRWEKILNPGRTEKVINERVTKIPGINQAILHQLIRRTRKHKPKENRKRGEARRRKELRDKTESTLLRTGELIKRMAESVREIVIILILASIAPIAASTTLTQHVTWEQHPTSITH